MYISHTDKVVQFCEFSITVIKFEV